jgi:hypothetical protein
LAAISILDTEFLSLRGCWIGPVVTPIPCWQAGGNEQTHDDVQRCGIKESASAAVQSSYIFCWINQ